MRLVLVVSLLVVAGPALAQPTRKGPMITVSSSSVAAPVFARAQRLVAEGQGAAGRAVVDSVIRVTSQGSDVFAEALYWRASLAATAADAERDYRTLTVEYSMSPRAPDALMRLGQLELARGDRAEALRHLERLVLEHPTSPARARASYWMARVYFDGNDAPRACASIDAARASAAPAEGALRAQLEGYATRCQGVARSTSGGDSTPAMPATTVVAPTPAAPHPGAIGVPRAVTTLSTTPAPATVAPAAKAAAATTRPASSGATSAPVYSVQLAAYDAVAPAEALVKRLRDRGIDARVSGTVRPYRVRVGRFATRAEAERESASLKQRGQSAWVVTESAP